MIKLLVFIIIAMKKKFKFSFSTAAFQMLVCHGYEKQMLTKLC